MTAEELRKRYNIPGAVLDVYESQVRKVFEESQTGKRSYDDQDLERIGRVMTLQEIGFMDEEIGTFFSLEKEGEITRERRLRMLGKRRSRLLDEIHQKEKLLGELDYLQYELKG